MAFGFENIPSPWPDKGAGRGSAENSKDQQCADTRSRKGVSPNPGGRPKEVGHVRELAREHTAMAVRTQVAITKNAKSPPAARVAAANALLDRGYGRPGSMSVRFKLPDMRSAADTAMAMAAIANAVACGDLTPAEAGELSKLVESYVRAIEASEIERRLRVLEASHAP